MIRYFKFFFHVLSICCLWFFYSCNQINVYEKTTPIPEHNWYYNQNCTGSFNISDTTSFYDIYIVIRHTDAYKYNNIWLNVGFQLPGDTLATQKINLLLGDDANGWYGNGIDDIWEVRKKLSKYPKQFKKKGIYNYVFSNIMRDNPLKNIMSVGLRIEKVKQ